MEAKQSVQEEQATPAALGWVCPMHPEVRSARAIACPECGMALEEVLVPGQVASDHPELREMRWRFVGAALLSVLLVLVPSLLSLRLGVLLAAPWIDVVSWVLASVVCFGFGWPIWVRALQALRAGKANMFSLIALGVGTAYGFSVVAWWGGLDAARHFGPAAMITALVLLGQVLELKARQRAGRALQELLDLAPPRALRVAEDGREHEVLLAAVVPGDRLRVRAGEKVPVDGVVLAGESEVNEAAFSGEPLPVFKKAGDALIGGSLNGSGSLLFEAQRVGGDTVLARIAQMVSEAQRSQAPIQRQVDRWAAYFVPGVLVVALVTVFCWGVFGSDWPQGLLQAVAVLIIACPCALGLATPMAILIAAGSGARRGLLFRDAQALETLAQVDVVALDKTGTLTEGSPRLLAMDLLAAPVESPAAEEAPPATSSEDLLRLAASLERGSEHPLGRAIVQAADAQAAERADGASQTTGFLPCEGFRSFPGRGVRGVVAGRDVVLGQARFFAELGIPCAEGFPASAADAPALAAASGDAPAAISSVEEASDSPGDTSLIALQMAVDGVPVARLRFADALRAGSLAALAALRAEGLRLVVLTGDQAAGARVLAGNAAIERIEAGLSPADKREVIRQLQAQGHMVAMVGDGVNDAPALAQAQLGVAIGSGVDAALESADLVLLRNDLEQLLRARALSRRTRRNVKQNLLFAFGYNVVGVALASGVLYPLFGWLLPPLFAAVAMSLSSLSVIGNALRLRSAAE